MANSNQRDEKIRYVFDTDGAEKLGAIEKTLGDITEKSLGTETAFGFVKQHLEELTVAALALGAAIKTVEFGKESIKNAEDVEVALSRVKATAQGTAEQFAGMDAAISDAAEAVNVSSQTAASGLAALVGTGKSVNDAMAALVPTLQLAKIANIDVAQAADIVGKSLDAFGIPAANTQHVVDLLTAASHGAAGGLGAVSNAAAQLAPSAHAIGLEFDDVVGVLGMLSDKGMDAEKATKALRSVFADLENPASKLRGELLALGDGTGDFNKAVNVLTSGTPRANEALLTLNGASRSVIQSLGEAGPGAIAKFTAELEKQSGVAARAASIIDDNLKGASTRFGLAIDEIGEKLAKPVLEPFKDELNKLSGELTKFANSPDFKDIENQVGSMAKDAAKALDDLVKSIDWKSFLKDGKETISGLTESFGKLSESVVTVATGIGKVMDGLGVAYHAASTTLHAAAQAATDSLGSIAEGVGSATLALNKLTGTSTDAAESLLDVGKNLHGASGLIGEETVRQIGATQKGLDSLVGSEQKATAATHEHAAAVADAAPKVDKYQEAEQRLAKAAADADAAQGKQARSAADVAQQFENLPPSIRATAIALAQSADSAHLSKDQIDSLATAFANLHIQSQTQLQSAAADARQYFETIDKLSADTAAGLVDRQNAFLAYAKAALAASANLDEGTKASTQYMLEAKASALGLDDALKMLEGTGKAAGDSTAQGADTATEALRREKHAMDDLGGSAQSAGESAKSAGDNVKDMAGGGGESLAQLDNALQNTRQDFLNVSEAAAKAFDAKLVSDWNLAFDSTGANIGKTVEALNNAAAQTRAQVAADREQLQGMIDSISSGAEKSTKVIDNMIGSIKAGTYQFGILGQQDLAPLLAALEAAKQKTEAADQAAASAAQRFGELARSIHDSLLQEQGDEAALEDERHANQLQALKDAAAAGKVSQQQYQQAVADENALHALKMQHLREQEQQQQQAKASGGGSSSAAGNAGGGVGATSSSSGTSQSASVTGGAISGGVPVTINYPGRTINVVVATPAQADSLEGLIQEIARQRTNSINK